MPMKIDDIGKASVAVLFWPPTMKEGLLGGTIYVSRNMAKSSEKPMLARKDLKFVGGKSLVPRGFR